jgi:hypothetical protein
MSSTSDRRAEDGTSQPSGMAKARLLKALRKLAGGCGSDDPERAHVAADHALLLFIGDAEISEAWHKVPKWFS